MNSTGLNHWMLQMTTQKWMQVCSRVDYIALSFHADVWLAAVTKKATANCSIITVFDRPNRKVNSSLFNYRLAHVIGASANSLCNDSNLIQIFTKKCLEGFLVYSSLIAWIKTQIGARALKGYTFLSTPEFLSPHDSKRDRFFLWEVQNAVLSFWNQLRQW